MYRNQTTPPGSIFRSFAIMFAFLADLSLSTTASAEEQPPEGSLIKQDAANHAEIQKISADVAATVVESGKVTVDVNASLTEVTNLRNQISEKDAEIARSNAAGAAVRQRLESEKQALLDGYKKATQQVEDAQKEFQRLNTNIADLSSKLEAEQKKREALDKAIAAYKALGGAVIAKRVIVKIGSSEKEIMPGVDTKATISNFREKCKVTVTSRSDVNLSNLISGIEIFDANGRRLASASKTELDHSEYSLGFQEICKANKDVLQNRDDLRLIITGIGDDGQEKVAKYRFIYNKEIVGWEIGIGTYLGAGDIREINKQTEFATFPSLKLGFRITPPWDKQPDFFAQANLLAGVGYAAGKKKKKDDMGQEVSDDNTPLAVFLGGSIAIGKYVEVGLAHDFTNNSTLVLFAPGTLLSTSIFSQ